MSLDLTDARARRRYLRDLRERADYLDASGSALLRKYGQQLSADVVRLLQDQLAAVRQAREACRQDATAEQVAEFDQKINIFDEALTIHLGQFRKSPTREYVEAILWAVILTLGIRTAVFEPFKIPSSSMVPTLQIHDHLFVNKFVYGVKVPFTRVKLPGLRDPQPGEIVVFEYPYEDDPGSAGKDLIKRVIGVAGDRVRMVDNVLYLNGKPVKRKVIAERGPCGPDGPGGPQCRIARECIGGRVLTTQHHVVSPGEGWEGDNFNNWPLPQWNPRFDQRAEAYSPPANRDFPDFVVPPGQLLVMGDNRDNSRDSRFFGLVPLETVKGKASLRFYAFEDNWFQPRLDRMFEMVHEEAPGGTCDNWDPAK